MIITCSQCQARFKIDPEQIKDSGSKVRCSNCRHVFTIYRPRPVQAPEPAELEKAYRRESDPMTSLLDEMGQAPAAASPRPDMEAAFEGAADRLGEAPSPEQDEPRAEESLEERRARRRRLYADLASEESLEDSSGYHSGGERRRRLTEDLERDEFSDSADLDERYGQDYPDEPEDYSDDELADGSDELEDDASLADDGQEDLLTEQDEEETAAFEPSYGRSAAGFAKDDDGLAFSPSGQPSADRRQPKVTIGLDPQRNGIRPAVTSHQPRRLWKILLPVLLIVAAAAALGYYFFLRPDPSALSDGSEGALPQQAKVAEDPSGVAHIAFPQGRENLNHFYRKNDQAGDLLIITGLVKNDYPEKRSFISLRASLQDSAGRVLAERRVYAGNTLSESDLQTLPISEIQSRLAIKGGRDGVNMNIEPGAELPFMIVFDKLPPDAAEYNVTPAGSSAAE